MHEHRSLPRARQDGLLEEMVGDELLLYDQSSHYAHCLNAVAASVWRNCDGERDVTQLAQLAGVNEDLVADALQELHEKTLLDGEPRITQSAGLGISRREAIGRGVRYGSAAVAMPMIVSATAATPAMASSGKWSCLFTATEGDVCCLCIGGQSCFTHSDVKTKKECEAACALSGSKILSFTERENCQFG